MLVRFLFCLESASYGQPVRSKLVFPCLSKSPRCGRCGRPLLSERQEALRAAHYNTELIPQDLIYVDLSTDSGVSSLSTNQLADFTAANFVEPGMGLAAEGSRSFARLCAEVKRIFGFPFVVPTTQGRAAERIWAKLNIRKGSVVAGNMLFPSTRSHIEMNGATLVDVVSDQAHDLASEEPFKGNVDIDKLKAVIAKQGATNISCLYVELALNACGGHPVSLANLKEVRAIAAAHKIPFFLDTCRILENSFLIKQGKRDTTTIDLGNRPGNLRARRRVTMSALKDFLVSSGGFILTR